MFSIHWKLCKEHTMGGRRGKHIQCPNKWLLSRNPSSESGCDSGAQAGVHTAAVIDLLIERAFPANGQVTPCNSQRKGGGNKN